MLDDSRSWSNGSNHKIDAAGGKKIEAHFHMPGAVFQSGTDYQGMAQAVMFKLGGML